MEQLKILSQLGHQGDTQWFSIKVIPNNAKKINKRFIAESEQSGSCHALSGNYDMYEVEDGFIIDAKEECVLNHTLKAILEENDINLEKSKVLPHKDHRHSIIPKGKYVVSIQQRFDPMEAIKKRVID